jgi:hypothetical protein
MGGCGSPAPIWTLCCAKARALVARGIGREVEAHVIA